MKIIDIPQSGSVGNQVSSRNRYGQYRRIRAVPVQPRTSFQMSVRCRLSVNAAAWRALTALQRAGWADLGAQMIRVDSLGQSNPLTGFQAYCSINNNNVAFGQPVVSSAPSYQTPTGLATMTVTLTGAAFSIAYTPTPLPTGTQAGFYCSLQRSAGRSFEADFRLIAVSTAAQASPMVLTTSYAARMGTPVTGNRVFIQARCFYAGFLSGPLNVSQVCG